MTWTKSSNIWNLTIHFKNKKKLMTRDTRLTENWYLNLGVKKPLNWKPNEKTRQMLLSCEAIAFVVNSFVRNYKLRNVIKTCTYTYIWTKIFWDFYVVVEETIWMAFGVKPPVQFEDQRNWKQSNLLMYSPWG